MEVLLKGVAIGLAVAAPVGPISLLCINRTLKNGQEAGLASGFGAATADAVYGIVAAAGLVSTGILIRYAVLMEFGGGLVIAILGALAIKKSLGKPAFANPPRSTRKNDGVWGAFATTFALTIANPMTIVAFIGFISALGVTNGSKPGTAYLVVVGVFIGSAMWWLFLVQITILTRTRLPISATGWLDLASGLAFLVWGIWIIYGVV